MHSFLLTSDSYHSSFIITNKLYLQNRDEVLWTCCKHIQIHHPRISLYTPNIRMFHSGDWAWACRYNCKTSNLLKIRQIKSLSIKILHKKVFTHYEHTGSRCIIQLSFWWTILNLDSLKGWPLVEMKKITIIRKSLMATLSFIPDKQYMHHQFHFLRLLLIAQTTTSRLKQKPESYFNTVCHLYECWCTYTNTF